MEPDIVVRDVHKSFGVGRNHVPILHGISLEVVPGETLYLVGPSGSGKTTLLSLMGCILTPDSGDVRVLGHQMSGMSSAQLTAFRRKYLSFVFQSFNLFPNLSALDNIRLMLCMRGVPGRDATKRANELLEQVGLGHRTRVRPSRLSTGECQRVAIARALANEPAVLLADEPTASLDAENGQSVMRLIKRLAHDRGVTLVIVTHDDRILPFADRILRLEDGRITREEHVRGPAHPQTASLQPDWPVPPDHRRPCPGPVIGRTSEEASVTTPAEPVQAVSLTSRIIAMDHGACSRGQIIVSNRCAASLVTNEIIVGCSAEPDFVSDPTPLDTVPKAALTSGSAAVRV